MFQLGSSLREARARRGLELAQVAAETRIRARYLQALEEERFELLPGSVYAKGFLRAYADYLGLDSQRYVDEYNARFSADETPPAPPQLKLRARVGYANPSVMLLGRIWISPPSLSRRRSWSGGPGLTRRRRGPGVGGVSPSARCGLWVL